MSRHRGELAGTYKKLRCPLGHCRQIPGLRYLTSREKLGYSHRPLKNLISSVMATEACWIDHISTTPTSIAQRELAPRMRHQTPNNHSTHENKTYSPFAKPFQDTFQRLLPYLLSLDNMVQAPLACSSKWNTDSSCADREVPCSKGQKPIRRQQSCAESAPADHTHGTERPNLDQHRQSTPQTSHPPRDRPIAQSGPQRSSKSHQFAPSAPTNDVQERPQDAP
jgi:hypothetical protein